jgi:hypothetical protein
MTTLHFERTLAALALAALVGLLAGAVGCGSDASDKASSPRGSSGLARDPERFARTARAPQDPPPPRPSTPEACDACHGLWAVHGIEPIETCICKTNDEGDACTDGNDCQGECLLDDDAEFHVMDQGDPSRGYYQGRCARYDTTFGCFRHVPPGIETDLPLTSEEAGPYICVD